MKTGVVDVGGGLRGIYATGVLDRCLEDGIDFDLGIGVSAGSANIGTYAARMLGRNFRFYTCYAFRKQYMSVGNFIRTGSYIDLDYVYGTLCNTGGEDPIDFEAIFSNPMEFIVVAADAETGEAKYFTKADIHVDDFDVCKGSSAIPFVCKPYEIDGRFYYDGALGDPVPIDKAFEEGCDKVVLLLTKPLEIPREPGKDELFAKLIKREHPKAARALELRAKRYNEGVERAKELAAEGKVLILAPDDTCGVDTLTRNKEALEQLYAKGYADGGKIADFLKER